MHRPPNRELLPPSPRQAERFPSNQLTRRMPCGGERADDRTRPCVPRVAGRACRARMNIVTENRRLLSLVDELESFDPIVDSKVMNLLPNSDTPQIFAACGRGARSTFRTLRHGLEVEEAVNFDLPGIPNAIWTTKLREDGPSPRAPI